MFRVIKVRRLREPSHVARMKKGKSAFNLLSGTPTRNIPLGRPRHRWEDNNRMDLKEIGINMIPLWRALVNTANKSLIIIQIIK